MNEASDKGSENDITYLTLDYIKSYFDKTLSTPWTWLNLIRSLFLYIFGNFYPHLANSVSIFVAQVQSFCVYLFV